MQPQKLTKFIGRNQFNVDVFEMASLATTGFYGNMKSAFRQ